MSVCLSVSLLWKNTDKEGTTQEGVSMLRQGSPGLVHCGFYFMLHFFILSHAREVGTPVKKAWVYMKARDL